MEGIFVNLFAKSMLVIPATYIDLDDNRDSFLVNVFYEYKDTIGVGNLIFRFGRQGSYDGDGLGEPNQNQRGDGSWRYHGA